jgi:hypothetical protein
MTQTTGGYAATDAKVEISSNGSTWVDISGVTNSVKPGKGTRMRGTRWTHEGDTAILTSGKRNTIPIDVSVIASEGTADPFETVRTAFEANTPLYLRWSPKGGTTGEFIFTTDPGYVDMDYPPTDAEDAKPNVISFTLETPKITKSVGT